MDFYFRTFDELSKTELYELIHLREKIFVVEQQSYYVDCDFKDIDAVFLIVQNNKNIIATLRILPNDQRFGTCAIGRFVIDMEYRKKGLGLIMLGMAVDYIKQNIQCDIISISAQFNLLNFYTKSGFVAVSDVYIEDGIEHILMQKNIF